MKKKIIIFIVFIIVIILGLFVGNQLLNFSKYNYAATDHYKKFMNGLENIKTVNLKKQVLSENEYYRFGNIKMKNDFQNFKKENFDDKTGFDTDNFEKLILSDKNGKTLASVWIGTNGSRVKNLINYSDSYYKENSIVTKNDIINFFRENNINNDIDLFKFLKTQKDIHINIFNNIHTMKNNYIIKFIISELPTFDSLTLMDDGYIINDDKVNEINFIKGNTNYFITVYNFGYFPNNYIDDFIKTIVIE